MSNMREDGKSKRYVFWKSDNDRCIYFTTLIPEFISEEEFNQKKCQPYTDDKTELNIFVHFEGTMTFRPTPGGDRWDAAACQECIYTGDHSMTDVKCKDGSKTCTGNFVPDDDMSVEQACDNCDSESPSSCNFQFGVNYTQTSTTESSEINELGGNWSITGTLGVDFLAKAEVSIKTEIEYKHTWENSKTQSKSVSKTVQSTCAKTLQGYKKTTAVGKLKTGTMTGDLVFTGVTGDTCGIKTSQEYPATVTMNNVVQVLSTITSCTFEDNTCPAPKDTYKCIDQTCQKREGGVRLS